METKEYRNRLQTKMIAEFQQEFFKKTGIRATVLLEDRGKKSNGIPYLDLDDLENHVNMFISPMLVPASEMNIRAKCRKRHLVYLRMVFCKLARSMGYTLNAIGSYLGRDHTTIIHGLRTASDLLDTVDPLFTSLFTNVTNYLRQYYAYESEPVISNTDQAPADTESVVPALLP